MCSIYSKERLSWLIKNIKCFEHWGMLAFASSFSLSLFPFLLFLAVLFTDTVKLFIQPLNTIKLSISSSFQSQIKTFLLPIKTLNPHTLFYQISIKLLIKPPFNSLNNNKNLYSTILNPRSTNSPNPKPTTSTRRQIP